MPMMFLTPGHVGCMPVLTYDPFAGPQRIATDPPVFAAPTTINLKRDGPGIVQRPSSCGRSAACPTATADVVKFVATLGAGDVADAFDFDLSAAPEPVLEALAARLAVDAALQQQLCLIKGGRIVIQVLKALPKHPATVQVLDDIAERLPTLMSTHAGCLVACGAYDVGGAPTQRIIYRYCRDHIMQLVAYEHGRMVVRHVLCDNEEATFWVIKAMLSGSKEPVVMTTVTKKGRNAITALLKVNPAAGTLIARHILRPENIRSLSNGDHLCASCLCEVIKFAKSRPSIHQEHQAVFAMIPHITENASFGDDVRRTLSTRKQVKELRKDMAAAHREEEDGANRERAVTTATTEELEVFARTLTVAELFETFEDLLSVAPPVLEALAGRLVTDRGLLRELSMTVQGSRIVLHIVTALPTSLTVSLMMERAAQRLVSCDCMKAEYIIVGRMYDVAIDRQRINVARLCVEHFMRLATHDHGSFVVRRVMSKLDGGAAARIVSIMNQPEKVRELAQNASGSGVLDLALTVRVTAPVIARTVMRPDMIRLLADHPHGKEVLRLVVRFVKSIPSAAREHEAVMDTMPQLTNGTASEDLLRKMLFPKGIAPATTTTSPDASCRVLSNSATSDLHSASSTHSSCGMSQAEASCSSPVGAGSGDDDAFGTA